MRTIKRRIDHLEAQHHIGDDTVEVITVLQRPDGTRDETHLRAIVPSVAHGSPNRRRTERSVNNGTDNQR